MVRYSFPVGLFHSLFHAGLSRRTRCSSAAYYLVPVINQSHTTNYWPPMNTDRRRFWLKPQIRLSSQLAGTTLAIVSALPLFAVEPPIVGSWRGVFHAMPDPG